MPVTAFGLKNFMAFGSTGFGVNGFVEFRKINLLYGRNSHGKSVMIRALRLLKQSLTGGDGQPLRFADESGVDIGSFKAALHKSPQVKDPRFHNGAKLSWTRPISFSFRCEIPGFKLRENGKQDWLTLKELSSVTAEDTLRFEVSLSYGSGVEKISSEEKVFFVGFDLWLVNSRVGNKSKTRLLTLQYDPDLNPQWSGYSEAKLHSNSSGALASYFTKECLVGFLPTLKINASQLSEDKASADVEREQIGEILYLWSLCREEIEEFLNSILYIGPIRPLPERYYLLDRRVRLSTTWEGAQAYREYLLNRSEAKYLQGRIEYWMSTFELGSSIRFNKENEIDTKDNLVSIRELVITEEKYSNDGQGKMGDRNLKDMGFGVSQILPVIISCLNAKDNAFIIIEQPELHLHPEAQASAADLFIECVSELTSEERNKDAKEDKGRTERSEREDKKRVGRRCLIETHSEHILLRLQLRMAGGKPRYLDSHENEEGDDWHLKGFTLAGSDFSLSFILRDRRLGTSRIEYIEADPYGKLVGEMDEFGSFFDRAFLDSSIFSIVSQDRATLTGKEIIMK